MVALGICKRRRRPPERIRTLGSLLSGRARFPSRRRRLGAVRHTRMTSKLSDSVELSRNVTLLQAVVAR